MWLTSLRGRARSCTVDKFLSHLFYEFSYSARSAPFECAIISVLLAAAMIFLAVSATTMR